MSRARSTICGYCGCNCGVRFLPSVGGRHVAVPAQDDAVSGGRLCVRGWQAGDLWRAPRRVPAARVLRDGQQQPADRVQAIQATAAALQRYTPSEEGSLGVLCCGHLTNEDAFVAAEFARRALGTVNVDNLGRAVDGAAVWGVETALCEEYRSPPLASLAESDVVLALNADLAWESPQAAAWIVQARKGGAQVMLLDEIGGGFAAHCDTVLVARPGMLGPALGVLLAAVADETTTADRTAAQQAGVPFDDMQSAAQLLRGAARPAIVASARALHRAQLGCLVGRLAHLLRRHRTGPHGPLWLVRSECNSYGVTLMGVSPLGNGDGPRERGLAAAEMLAGGLRALVAVDVGLEAHTGAEGLRKLRDSLEFLCVISSLESETTALADVVLPMRGWGARDGSLTGGDGHVRALAGDDGDGADVPGLPATLADLAAALGRPLPPTDISAVRGRISSNVFGFGKIDWSLLAAGQDAALGSGYSATVEEEDGELVAAQAQPTPIVGEGPERALTLLVRRDEASWAFEPRARAAPLLEREHKSRLAPYVSMSPETARKADLRPGRPVALETAFGRAQPTLRVSGGIPEGVVVVPWQFRDLVFGLCGPGELDPRTATAFHPPVAAAIVPEEGGGA